MASVKLILLFIQFAIFEICICMNYNTVPDNGPLTATNLYIKNFISYYKGQILFPTNSYRMSELFDQGLLYILEENNACIEISERNTVIENLLFAFIKDPRIPIEEHINFLLFIPIYEFVNAIESDKFTEINLIVLSYKLIGIKMESLSENSTSCFIFNCEQQIKYRQLCKLPHYDFLHYLLKNKVTKAVFDAFKIQVDLGFNEFLNNSNIIELIIGLSDNLFSDPYFKDKIIELLLESTCNLARLSFHPFDILRIVKVFIKNHTLQHISHLLSDPFKVKFSDFLRHDWLQYIIYSDCNHDEAIKLFFDYTKFIECMDSPQLTVIKIVKIFKKNQNIQNVKFFHLHHSVDYLFKYIDISQLSYIEFTNLVQIYCDYNCVKVKLFIIQFIKKIEYLSNKEKGIILMRMLLNKRYLFLIAYYNYCAYNPEFLKLHKLINLPGIENKDFVETCISIFCKNSYFTKHNILDSIKIILRSKIPELLDTLFFEIDKKELTDILDMIDALVPIFIEYRKPQYIAYFIIHVIPSNDIINTISQNDASMIIIKYYKIIKRTPPLNGLIPIDLNYSVFCVFFTEFLIYNFNNGTDKHQVENIIKLVCSDKLFTKYIYVDSKFERLISIILRNLDPMLYLSWILNAINSLHCKLDATFKVIVFLHNRNRAPIGLQQIILQKYSDFYDPRPPIENKVSMLRSILDRQNVNIIIASLLE